MLTLTFVLSSLGFDSLSNQTIETVLKYWVMSPVQSTIKVCHSHQNTLRLLSTEGIFYFDGQSLLHNSIVYLEQDHSAQRSYICKKILYLNDINCLNNVVKMMHSYTNNFESHVIWGLLLFLWFLPHIKGYWKNKFSQMN